MKYKKPKTLSEEEILILGDQLEPQDLFIIGYLKGFDRRTTQRWTEKELWN